MENYVKVSPRYLFFLELLVVIAWTALCYCFLWYKLSPESPHFQKILREQQHTSIVLEKQ